MGVDDKSFKRIQNRRIVLDLVDGQTGDPRLAEEAVFYFGDDPFIMTSVDIRHGDTTHHCTKIFMMGREFIVTMGLEDLNYALFHEEM